MAMTAKGINPSMNESERAARLLRILMSISVKLYRGDTVNNGACARGNCGKSAVRRRERRPGVANGDAASPAPYDSISVMSILEQKDPPPSRTNTPGLSLKSPENPSGSVMPCQGSMQMKGAPGLVQTPR
jgi:hypothetical protein